MPVLSPRSLPLLLAAPLALGLLASTGPAHRPAEQSTIPLPDLDGDHAPERLVAPAAQAQNGPSLATVLSGPDPLYKLPLRPGDTPLRAALVPDADADGAPDLLLTFFFTDPQGDAYEIDATYAAADGALLAPPDPARARLLRLAADLDGNGRVDAADAAILLHRLRAGDPIADLNADGRADARDLLHLRAQFGRALPEVPTHTRGGPTHTGGAGGGGTNPGGGTPGSGGGGMINPADPGLTWEGNSGDGTRPPDDDDDDDDGDGDDDQCDGAVFYTNNDDDDFDALFDKDEHAAGAAGLTREVTDEDDLYGARFSPPASLPNNTQSTRWKLTYPAQLRFWYRPDAGDILDDAVTAVPEENRTRRKVDGVEWVLLPSNVLIHGPMQQRSFAVEAVSPSNGKCDLTVTATHISTYLDSDGHEREQTNTSAPRVASAYEIAIDAADESQATHLDIGHWGDDGANNTLTGYDASGAVHNNAPGAGGTFIEGDPNPAAPRPGDPDRFRVRIVHHGLNKDPNQIDRIPAVGGSGGAWGLSSHEAYAPAAAAIDPATELHLRETGNNTGIFVSEFQLLVCLNGAVLNPDDQFQVHSAYCNGTVADEALNDRTHQATVDGAVRFTRAGLGPRFERWCPVSERRLGPNGEYPSDGYKVLTMRARILLEPFQDIGFDNDNDPTTPHAGANNGQFDWLDTPDDGHVDGRHDPGEPSEPYRDLSVFPYDVVEPMPWRGGDDGITDGYGTAASTDQVDAHLRRAQVAWAQAGIKVERLTMVIVVPGYDPDDQTPASDVLTDGWFDLAPGGEVGLDQNTLMDRLGDATFDTLEVLFVGPLLRHTGNTLEVVNARCSMPGLHASIEQPQRENTYIFIGPAIDLQYRTLAHEIGHALTNLGDLTLADYLFFRQLSVMRDDSVVRYRRILHGSWGESAARSERPEGELTTSGNRLLRNP